MFPDFFKKATLKDIVATQVKEQFSLNNLLEQKTINKFDENIHSATITTPITTSFDIEVSNNKGDKGQKREPKFKVGHN